MPKGYFRYRNARSHRPVLETEERIQKFVDTEENEPTKIAKNFIIFHHLLHFLLFPFLNLNTKICKNLKILDSLSAPIETGMLDF